MVLRGRIKSDSALTGKRRGHQDNNKQLVLALPHDEAQDNAQVCECAVLATGASCDIAAIGQPDRDRCNCRSFGVSGFDTL